MVYSVYVGDTGSELASVRGLLLEQIRQAGLQPVTLSQDARQDDAGLRGRVRAKIGAADTFIAMITFRRGWEPASFGGQSLAEVEYDLAQAMNKPIAILMPRSDSELADDLRQRAVDQNPVYREAQRAFRQRLERENAVLWFADEADFSEQVADLLYRWSPGQSGSRPEAAAGRLGRWWQRLFDVDGLADRIADRVFQRLRDSQQQAQVELARQTMRYQEAMRLKPGELVFGKPLTTSQFQSDLFVIMPFAAEFDPVYRGVIQPLLADLNLRGVRGDEFASQRGSIIEEVWAALNNCRLVIADITGGNDNVFYELGIAHTLNKPAIIITQAQTPEGVPFDIRHLRYIPYQNEAEGHTRLRADLQAAITWLLADIEESQR
ncbi:MAG TPA: DUF4062 domain-containing protein [Spirillospora sp.]|nr:DUF4062 domain-containing protein [Spirillospora sp.]